MFIRYGDRIRFNIELLFMVIRIVYSIILEGVGNIIIYDREI